MKLPHRSSLADVCNALNLTSAVEIGTHHAIFADQFMLRFRGKISLVDPWLEQDKTYPTFYPSLKDISESREDDFRIAKALMEKYGDRVEFLRMTSEEASCRFAPNSLDFVYIDGLHEFNDVWNDLNLWYHKVREGGIISGHDYHPEVLPGVVQAVNGFFLNREFQLFFTSEGVPSWWGIKQKHSIIPEVHHRFEKKSHDY